MSTIELSSVERRIVQIITEWTADGVYRDAEPNELGSWRGAVFPVCRFLILAVYRDWSKVAVDTNGISVYTDREAMRAFDAAIIRLRQQELIRLSPAQPFFPRVHRILTDGRVLKVVHRFPPPGENGYCDAYVNSKSIWHHQVRGDMLECFELTKDGCSVVDGGVDREAPPAYRKRLGRPPGPSDAKRAKTDQDLYAAWSTGQYRRYEDLAREKNSTAEDVRQAVDRCRPRRKK